MKNWKFWVILLFVVLLLLYVVVHFSKKDADNGPQVRLPPSDTTLAGQQEPISSKNYELSTPLSKNKIIYKEGMKIEITKEGSGEEIKNGQTAVVDYLGRLENGTEFDASKNHGDGTFSFPLGAGRVIRGWDEGVLGMKVGESRTLTVPPELAYGPNGVPGVIPPNATLIFQVTLLAIQ